MVGDGSELARIELLLGSKSGPVGEALGNALVKQKEGDTNVLPVVTANLPAKPDTMITNKVTLNGEKQTVQMLGPAQAAVARAANRFGRGRRDPERPCLRGGGADDRNRGGSNRTQRRARC